MPLLFMIPLVFWILIIGTHATFVHISRLLERSELLLTTQTWHDEPSILFLSDQASVHELLQQTGRCVSVLLVLLHHPHLLLESLILWKFGGLLLLLEQSGLLLVLDLLFGSSPFALCLKEVGRHTLARLISKKKWVFNIGRSTYCSQQWIGWRSSPFLDPSRSWCSSWLTPYRVGAPLDPWPT